MTNTRTHRQHGFSLVELMVGLTLGMFVTLGALTATTGLLRGDAVAASRLDQEVRNVAFVFERDVMRAGFRGDAAVAAATGVSAYTSPFDTLDTSTAGCVRFSYDLNKNGVLDTLVADERFAYVLANGVLFLRTGGTNFNCDTTQGTWEPVTDAAAVQVSSFVVSVVNTDTAIPGSTRFMRQRVLTYAVTATNVKNPAQSQAVTNSVKLPNDIVS